MAGVPCDVQIMEAARTLPFFATRAVNDEVVIDGLRVHDETLLRLVREREDVGANPDAMVRDVLEIGARILQRELTGAETDLVKTEFEGLKGSITDHTKRLADRMDEKVTEVFDAESGEFARLVAKHFGEESTSAVQHRVKAVMADAATQLREDLRKQLASESDDNPLAKFHRVQMEVADRAAQRHGNDMRALNEKLEAMRLEVEKLRGEREKLTEVAAEAERGTAKGRSYEEQVYEALDAIAGGAGDDCDAVGDFLNGAGGKKGDVVVSLDATTGPARGRIVFEAKNSKLSKNEAMSQLDGARETRSADYAVLVVPSTEKLPARTHPLREYNGDKLLVVFDPEESTLSLEVAYQLARARVLMRRGESHGVDVDALNAELDKALLAMEDVRRIKQRLTAAKTSIDDSAGILDVMATGVRSHLQQFSMLLAAAETADDAAT